MADNVLVLLPDMYKFAIAVNDPKMMAMRLTFYLPRTEDSPSKNFSLSLVLLFVFFFVVVSVTVPFFFLYSPHTLVNSSLVMKVFYALVFFSVLQLSSVNAETLNRRHRDLRLKRQQPGTAATPAPNTRPPPSSSTPSPPSNVPSLPPHPASQTTPSSSSTSTGPASAAASTTLSGSSTVLNATSTGPPPLDTGTSIPPLANITLGMPTQAPLAISSTYAPGATPPISGAPVLPTLRK